MLELWIISACAIASIILALCNDAAWRRKYQSLLDLAHEMNETWADLCQRQNEAWKAKCMDLKKDNDQLREQLQKDGEPNVHV